MDKIEEVRQPQAIPNPILKGRGGREFVNGATCQGSKYVHLGYSLPNMMTLCGKAIEGFMVTYADVEITCPQCIKKIRGGQEDEQD